MKWAKENVTNPSNNNIHVTVLFLLNDFLKIAIKQIMKENVPGSSKIAAGLINGWPQ